MASYSTSLPTITVEMRELALSFRVDVPLDVEFKVDDDISLVGNMNFAEEVNLHVRVRSAAVALAHKNKRTWQLTVEIIG